MILKKENKEIVVSLKKKKTNFGLRDGDVWCLFEVSILGDNFNFSEEAISWNEVIELINTLEKDLHCDSAIKKRIVFIKNYFIFYLNFGKKKKSLKLKFIHINDTEENFIIEFVNEEILEFIKMLKK